MHKLKEWQIMLIVLIITILFTSILAFDTTSCDVIAVDNQLYIMEHKIETNNMQLENGKVYTIKWYNMFNETHKTTIKKAGGYGNL